METVYNTPLKGNRPPHIVFSDSPASIRHANQRSPPPAATLRVQDRYLPPRAAQDNSLAHFLLTTSADTTPVRLLSQPPLSPSQPSDSAASSPLSRPPRLPSRTTASSPPLRRPGSPSVPRSTSRSPSIGDVFTKLRLGSSRVSGRGSVNEESPLAGGRAAASESPSYSSPSVEVEPYTNRLARTLFSDAPQTSVLGLDTTGPAASSSTETGASSHGGPRPPSAFDTSLGVVFEANRARNFTSAGFRLIPQTPERILDAADMIDDFYLNLMDWSSSDVLAVALQRSVYLWAAATGSITQLPPSTEPEEVASVVCGVSWSPDSQLLGLGLQDGVVEVWDVTTQQSVYRLQQHGHRVGSLAWAGGSSRGGPILASGSKDSTIGLHDLREAGRGGGAGLDPLCGHHQEVCGLRWSPDGTYLASGGNDNQLLVWDRRMLRRAPGHSRMEPLLYLNAHTAAVKALAWNPARPSLLASGGGTDDQTLRFWNTSTGECLHQVNTQSQVCGVVWNHTGTELVSAHGYSRNQLTIWKYPTLRRVADLTGHTSRVLHLCLSADGEVVVSAAGDETIRFWRCFAPADHSEPSPHLHRCSTMPAMPSLFGSTPVRGCYTPSMPGRASSTAPGFVTEPLFRDELMLR